MPTFQEMTEPPPEPGPADWNDEGVVIKKNLLPEEVLTNYEQFWLTQHSENPKGWPDCLPYMRHQEVADLYCRSEIQEVITELLGQPAGLHLCLTGWVTTTRNWHQDSYLNPHFVGDNYVAVWIALADIHPDSGPFQYVAGSHRWPQVTFSKISEHVDTTDPLWPSHSEQILTPIFEEEIEARNAEITTYLPKRGDVLFWHGRLMHRGSLANTLDMERRAAIGHYSGISSRPDMPKPEKSGGGWIFPIGEKLYR
jgi:ectoine hydroxylase-related dioxygenase (phytanoyl-CoA dioxygenase family)